MCNGGSDKEPLNDGGGDKKCVSFKDTMMANKTPLAPHSKVDLIEQKLAMIVFLDDNPFKPMVEYTTELAFKNIVES
ncbi:hypothetical protein GmHk_08G022314 [Glycine max]|nr:hypothetical protein GmHk_08G022314 [Glycine max]